MTKIDKSPSGAILRVERTVERVDRSPLNKRVKVVQLNCGHELYIRPPARAPRIGSAVACNECKRSANSGTRSEP